MPKHLAYAAITGLLSSGLFFMVFGANLGFVFMFLPTLPLFFLGLGTKSDLLVMATLAAALIIALCSDVASGILFLIFLGIPTWYFCKKALLLGVSSDGTTIHWYPVGRIMMHMALYACTIVALMVGYYAGLPGGLPQILSENIHEAFMDLQEEYGDIIDQMANGFVFLMFPVTIWLWSILLYGHAWFSNRLLANQHKQIRLDLSVTLFTLPGWMLQLLAIAGLASLIGGTSVSFLGKTTLLSLMLPYFFLGCAVMHNYCKTTHKSSISTRFLIFFVYFMVFTQFWPVLILAAIGLWHQIKCLSATNSWFKS